MGLKDDLVATRAMVLVFAVLTAYHISLLGQGALAWGDEWRSFDCSRALAFGVLEGSISQIGYALADFGARPGEYLLRFPASLAQILVEQRIGLPARSPDSLRIATAQNVLVSLGLSVIFWRVSLQVLCSRGLAALSSIAFALLASNQMWVRHLIPYDAALLVHLAVLGLCIRSGDGLNSNSLAWKNSVFAALALGISLVAYPVLFHWERALGLPLAAALLAVGLILVGALYRDWASPGGSRFILAGVGSGAALSIYPAYYSFTLACGVILLIGGRADRVADINVGSIRKSALFGASVLAVLLVFEVFGRLGGISYLGSARLLSGTITQGIFEEGFVFLPKYLIAVDGLGGLAIVLLAAVGGIALARREVLVVAGTVRVLLVFLAIYSIYAFQSVVLHRMAFTGRYARMYIPILIWLAALGLLALKGRARRLGGLAWTACGTIGFLSFAAEYRGVAYPADVLYSLGIGYEDVAPENILHDFEPNLSYNLPVKAVTAGSLYRTHPNDHRFVLLNFAWPLAPRGPGAAVLPGAGYEATFDAKHFLSLRAFGWEGAGAAMREVLYQPGFRLKVFQRVGPVSATSDAPASERP